MTWRKRACLRGWHYADSGYLSAELAALRELARHGIALIGPLLADTSAQARAAKGYARADFTIDDHHKTVPDLPAGQDGSVLAAAAHP